VFISKGEKYRHVPAWREREREREGERKRKRFYRGCSGKRVGVE